MLKVLIIEDTLFKETYLKTLCLEKLGETELLTVSNLATAYKHIGTFYDLVLCDLHLGNDVADSFALDYKTRWEQSFVLLYSGITEGISEVSGIRLIPSDSIAGQIDYFKKVKRIVKKTNTDEYAVLDKFNGKECDLKHGFLNTTIEEIKENLSSNVKDLKNEISAIRLGFSSFREESSKSSRNIIITIAIAIISPFIAAFLKKIGWL